MILQSLAGLPAFLVYFCTALIAVVAYLFVYTRVTPHDEFQLIRDNDPAAAIALGLSLLGFVLPVVSAIAHSANVIDCLIWSIIALIVQIIVYYIVKIPVPNLSARIASGEMAVAYLWQHWGVLGGTPGSFWPYDPAAGGNGGEASLLFCFAFLLLATLGGGALSVDGRRRVAGGSGVRRGRVVTGTAAHPVTAAPAAQPVRRGGLLSRFRRPRN